MTYAYLIVPITLVHFQLYFVQSASFAISASSKDYYATSRFWQISKAITRTNLLSFFLPCLKLCFFYLIGFCYEMKADFRYKMKGTGSQKLLGFGVFFCWRGVHQRLRFLM